MKSYSNEQLIKAIGEGDQRALTFLYHKYGPRIKGYILKNSGELDDANDMIQKTILVIWEKVKSGAYTEQAKFDQFIGRVASNLWLSELRSRRRNPTVKLGKGEEMLEDTGSKEIIGKAFRGKALDAMYTALNQLGTICQRLIELYHLEEKALKEIAIEENVTYGSLRKRIYDCRNKLRKLALEELA